MQKRGSIGLGVVFILIGLIALLYSLGIAWLQMERLWPTLVILLGVWSLVNGLRSEPREPDNVWFGVMASLGGAVLLYVTLGPGEWGQLSRQWPIFPLLAAAGWLAAWMVDLRQTSNLVASLVAVVVSVIGFMYTRGLLNAVQGRQVLAWWPLILIILGLGWILQYVVQRR